MSGTPYAWVTVSGGGASIHADLEDLRGVRLRHGECADRLLGPAHRAEATARHLDPAPEVAPSAAVLRERLWDGQAAIQALHLRLADTARTMARAVENYRVAEQGAEGVVDAVHLDAQGLATWYGQAKRDGLDAEEVEFALRQGNEVAVEQAISLAVSWLARRFGAKTVPPVRSASGPAGPADEVLDEDPGEKWRGHRDRLADWAGLSSSAAARGVLMESPVGELVDYPSNSRAAAAFVVASRLLPTDLEVESVTPTRASVPQALGGGASDLGGLVEAAQTTPGGVTVTRVQAGDGRDTWIVAVPGTQDGAMIRRAEGNPWDLLGIADAYGTGSAWTAPGLARAMEAAGVPDGARVVFAGHSQGGLHALNAARSPATAQRWEVAGVVTFGAPAGNVQTPPGLPVLSFQRSTDQATGLDGGPDPVSASRATVTFHRPEAESMLPAPGDGLSGLHGLDVVGPEHALEAYLIDVRAYEAAPSETKTALAPQLAAISALTAGAVRGSSTVRLRRRKTGARHGD